MYRGNCLHEISTALTRLLNEVRDQPIVASQTCELELELCVTKLRELLGDLPPSVHEAPEILATIRHDVSELQGRIKVIHDLNARALGAHTLRLNGYDGGGRPAGC